MADRSHSPFLILRESRQVDAAIQLAIVLNVDIIKLSVNEICSSIRRLLIRYDSFTAKNRLFVGIV